MPDTNETKRHRLNAVFQLNIAEDLTPVDVNGRACYRIPAKTLPDSIVMNDVLYSAEAIEEGYHTLENTPAPLEHPKIDDWYVSASDPQAINRNWVGAWNANVRRVLENNARYRVHYDLMIDIRNAESTEKGKRVLNAIKKREPIHTSNWSVLQN